LQQGQSSWRCPDCGKQHDRDDNASTNLEPSPTVGATGRAVLVTVTPDREGRLQSESSVPQGEAKRSAPR
jgi:transposase